MAVALNHPFNAFTKEIHLAGVKIKISPDSNLSTEIQSFNLIHRLSANTTAEFSTVLLQTPPFTVATCSFVFPHFSGWEFSTRGSDSSPLQWWWRPTPIPRTGYILQVSYTEIFWWCCCQVLISYGEAKSNQSTQLQLLNFAVVEIWKLQWELNLSLIPVKIERLSLIHHSTPTTHVLQWLRHWELVERVQPSPSGSLTGRKNFVWIHPIFLPSASARHNELNCWMEVSCLEQLKFRTSACRLTSFFSGPTDQVFLIFV